MNGKQSLTRCALAGAAIVAASVLAATPASAVLIDWTAWGSATVGTPGVAQGTIAPDGVTVSYVGEVRNLFINFPSWQPSPPTFSGGTVGDPPPSSGGIIQLFGGAAELDTLTFSTPVINPVMAIWSLGNGGDTARFDFTAAEPFTIESGGPSAEFGGSSIFLTPVIPNSISGTEGNGTIRFNGTFTAITWTNPVFENWYGFTVGIAGVGPSGVPEPSTLVLLGSGLVGLAGVTWRRQRRK
jgi:PEP-CTERM motif-containing protein